MPFIDLKTNVSIADKEALKAKLGEIITLIPGKTEARTMVRLEDKCDLYFAGSGEPCAIVDTLVNSGTDYSTAEDYCQAVIDALSTALGLPEKRIYVTVDTKQVWISRK